MDPEEEVQNLRECLDWLCQQSWEGGDIDGGVFQDGLERMGILVRVPATQQFREEWDADEMLIQRWKEKEIRAVLELEAMAQAEGGDLLGDTDV